MANPSSLSSSRLTCHETIDLLSYIKLREIVVPTSTILLLGLCRYGEIYDQWLAWTRNLKENQDTSGVSRSQKVPSISITDLPKYIENYATAVESNLEKAYEIMRDLMLQFSITHTLEDLDTLRCIFKKAFQEMHQHSLNEERLVDIFCRLQEANICTVELLQNVKKCAEFCKQFSSTTSKYDFYQFFYRIFDPIINSIKNSITKFKYAASIYGASIIEYMYIPLFSLDIMVYIIPIIIIVIFLFICQPSLESVTDMEQLTIFATVIHLIICGDVESNPGPEYDAEELLRKEPKVSDFQRIFIQSGAACHWQILGRALDIDVNDLIDCPHSAAVMIGTVFERWRDQHKDFTWKRIIRACEGYDQFGRVRDAIIKFLSSREAHSKYGSEPDFDCTYTGSITIHKESKENENGYLNKTVIILLIALIVLVLCNFIYQVWADLALQGQGWPRETTCRTDCEC